MNGIYIHVKKRYSFEERGCHAVVSNKISSYSVNCYPRNYVVRIHRFREFLVN
ncbi:uncharacterized protein METZ01_LOCUS92887, partial [marine metagenome]